MYWVNTFSCEWYLNLILVNIGRMIEYFMIIIVFVACIIQQTQIFDPMTREIAILYDFLVISFLF